MSSHLADVNQASSLILIKAFLIENKKLVSD